MKYSLSLDNLVYKLVIRNEEDITFILPHGIPNDKQDKKKNNIFVSLNDIVIKVFIDTTQVTNVPKFEIVGKDEFTKIVTNGSFKLLPNSMMEVTFSTVDGGLHWLVNSCNANEVTAEGAEKIAKNAQEVAIEATNTANTAVETATTAKAISETANTNSLNAINTSSKAVQVATSANDKATIAVNVSAEAKTIAEDSKTESASAVVTSDQTKEAVDNLNTLVNELTEDLGNTKNSVNENKTNIQELTNKVNALEVEKSAIEARLTALEEKLNIVIKHTQNIENSVFWIDGTTLKPTRPTVDPDTLEPMQ